MSKGAQPTESVAQLFRTNGLLDRFSRFKSGESIETLLGEVAAVNQEKPANSKNKK